MGMIQSQANEEQIADSFYTLLQKSPSLNIKTLELSNDKGKSDIALALNLAQFDLNAPKELKNILAIFKQSHLKIKLDLESTKKLVAQLVILDGASSAEAEEIAQQRMNELVSGAKMASSEYFNIDDKSISLALEIDNGAVKLNGNALSEEQVSMMLFAIMFGAGSLMH